MLLIALIASALAANPTAVSPKYGIVGKEIMIPGGCSVGREANCVNLVNNTTEAVSFGFSYQGPAGQDGIDGRLVVFVGGTAHVEQSDQHGINLCVE